MFSSRTLTAAGHAIGKCPGGPTDLHNSTVQYRTVSERNVVSAWYAALHSTVQAGVGRTRGRGAYQVSE